MRPLLAPTPKIAGFNPLTGNAGISYIRKGITVRLLANHRGKYLSTYNTDDSRLVYSRNYTHLDLKTQYNISKHYDVYLDINNLTWARDRGTEIGGRPGMIGRLTPQFFFGVNGRL